MKDQAKAEKTNKWGILNLIQNLVVQLLQKVRCQIKFSMTSLFNHTGFTLIELLVVVLIIGILASIALPQYQKAVAKARATEAVTHMKALENAISLWVLEHGMPTNTEITFFGGTDSENLDIDVPCNPSNDSGSWCSFNDIFYSAFCTSYCELSAFSTNTGGSFEMVIEIDNTGRPYFHKCGYRGNAGKAACDIVAAQGWEAEEGWEQ